jgi:NADH-quinone oxidoreductase subunit L
MFRLTYLTFYGKFRGSKQAEHHLHESPKTMTVPLIALAVLSAIGGYLGLPRALGGSDWFGQWMAPVIRSSAAGEAIVHEAAGGSEYAVMFISIVVALAGIWMAHSWYIRRSSIPQALSQTMGYRLLLNKYYVDQIYDRFISQPIVRGAEFFAKVVDMGTVDGLVNGVATFFSGVGGLVRRVQTGVVQNYAIFMGLGLIAVLTIFLCALWA